MLELLNGPFLGLIFSYYILMTFLMMLSVTLLSVLMILLSTVSEIRCQICGKALASGFESELRDTKNWSRKRLVYFNNEKDQLGSFD